MTEQKQAPLRSAFVSSILIGGALIIVGLLVGFTQKSTSKFGGAQCGSVLGGGSDELTATGVAVCEKALSTPTTWTWLLIAVGVAVVLAGMVVNSVGRSRSAH